MSYELIYNAQFLKTSKGTVVPVLLSGSNNVWEVGNKKRAREWHCSAFPMPEGHSLDFEIHEIEAALKNCSDYDSYVKIHGKWASTQQYRKYIINCAKKAKQIEELHEYDRPHAYWYVYTNANSCTEGSRRLNSTADLEQFIRDFKHRQMKKKDGEILIPVIRFWSEKLIHQHNVNKKRGKKPRLDEFYALCVYKGPLKYYVKKLTARKLQYTYSADEAKQFGSEKEALKWYEQHKIKSRFGVELFPEHIKA